TVNAGTLAFNNDADLGAVPGSVTAASITLSGGTLKIQGNGFLLNANRGITVTATGSVIDDSTPSGTLTIGGVISGTGSLTKAGTKTMLMIGNSSGFTGNWTINDGRLNINNSGSTN